MIAPDIASIFSSIDTADEVGAIVAAGALLVAVGFGIWTSGTIGRFFSAGDPMKDKSSPEYHEWYEEQMRREREEAGDDLSGSAYVRSAARAGSGDVDRPEEAHVDDTPGFADALVAEGVGPATATASSGESASTDFSGGGGDFGGGGASDEW